MQPSTERTTAGNARDPINCVSGSLEPLLLTWIRPITEAPHSPEKLMSTVNRLRPNDHS